SLSASPPGVGGRPVSHLRDLGGQPPTRHRREREERGPGLGPGHRPCPLPTSPASRRLLRPLLPLFPPGRPAPPDRLQTRPGPGVGLAGRDAHLPPLEA